MTSISSPGSESSSAPASDRENQLFDTGRRRDRRWTKTARQQWRALSAASSAILAPGGLLPAGGLTSLTASANRGLVTAYKLIGFLVLTTILVGITSFVTVHSFYVVHRAWVVPRIISPGDPEVVDARARLAEETWKRQSIEAERRATRARLERLKLSASAEDAFQDDLPSAVASGTAQRQQILDVLEVAREEQRRVREDLARIGQSLADSSREQLQRDFDARLITQQELLEGSYQLARLAETRSNLLEREAVLDERIERLGREVDALQGAAALQQGAPPSYEGLLLRRELARSRAEGLAAMTEVDALTRSIDDLKRALSEYDGLLALLRADPLLDAREQPLHVAFISYEGQASVAPGAELYGCRAGLVLCKQVGRVVRYLPGERMQRHPVYGEEIRGRWLQIELSDPGWARAEVLHARRPPLLF